MLGVVQGYDSRQHAARIIAKGAVLDRLQAKVGMLTFPPRPAQFKFDQLLPGSAFLR